ncbi:cyclophane-forming radical SAM peptide maturase AmcB [Actinokineospora globicatena]|uniref:cyclophane-forming radical SAM peptide maturase AmcB n=1 Tax=Actinokineospora globicatena TaxID=103729 RepID=UPI002556E489|nr:cyclophane-forming radical SAM peptide maturase AmcB [Actinokineospora globicatena]
MRTAIKGLLLRPRSLILQPETLCNLDCGYCYLPFRHERNTMPISVARAVADSIRPWVAYGTVDLCWHGGEPLATGRDHLGKLIGEFAGLDVKHGVQTNATLIDSAWCDFFAERDMYVGVSVDGWSSDNANRVDRAMRPAYDRIMRGIELLRAHGHDVFAIAVVSNPSPERARRLYSFAVEAGITSLGVNIEEREGVNASVGAHDRQLVEGFWSELLRAWKANPVTRVRELDRVLGYVRAVLESDEEIRRERPFIDPLPTVAYDGSVTLISPELAGFSSDEGNFSSGNVLDKTLSEIIKRSVANTPWISDFSRGVDGCEQACPYFAFCGGGHPANRYFEQGRMSGTETDYCRNSKIALFEGVMHVVQLDPVGAPNPEP